jgi:ubiquinone/menaquinone biosynthesis C-methylase UbiE
MNECVLGLGLVQPTEGEFLSSGSVDVPDYLSRYYWWAYIHPWAVAFFDHLWIVNLILLCNYKRLRDCALREFGNAAGGRVLQLACVYGDVTPRLAEQVSAGGGALDVVDVLPIQLRNLKRKLPEASPVRLINMDSSDLNLPSAHYDQVLLFFLLHEQPNAVRLRTLREAVRVLKPGGRILVVDFARPFWWNPFRYLWRIFLAIFEPFALDLWWNDISTFLPSSQRPHVRTEERLFGGLFQKVVIETSVLR